MRFGFRQDHSTSHAAPQISETMNNSFKHGEIPQTVFGDFRKAFDTVDFEILTKRLERLGVKGAWLNRFKNILCDKSVHVVINSVVFSIFEIN